MMGQSETIKRRFKFGVGHCRYETYDFHDFHDFCLVAPSYIGEVIIVECIAVRDIMKDMS